MATNGNNIIVYQQSGQSWVAIGATRSNELSAECDTLERSSATDAEYKHYVSGRKSWSLNISWLVTTLADVRKVLLVGTRVKIRVGGRTFSASAGVEGYAIVKLCKMTATRGNIANGSLQLQGDGPLT
jgi:hypothetical protein